MAQRAIDPVGAAEHVVHAARTAGEAVSALRDALLPFLPVDVVSIVTFRDEEAVFAATSDDSAFYRTGTQVGYGITDDVTKIVSTLLLGRAIRVRLDEYDIGLLALPLEQEGIAVAIAAPVMDGEVVVGALAAAARDPDAFTDDDVAVFEQIARAVGARLLELLATAKD